MPCWSWDSLWLVQHKPHIDWEAEVIQGRGASCQLFCIRPEPTKSKTGYSPVVQKVEGISSDYHNFHKVFSKKKATYLPSHREYDFTIDLLPGSAPPQGRLYSLSKPEHDAIETYIWEWLAARIT